jgi:hypothetical protein
VTVTQIAPRPVQIDQGETTPRTLTANEYAAVATVASMAIVLGLLGFANSFAAVMAAAQPSFGVMAWSVPLGIDLGIAVFAALDIVLGRLNMRLRWLRSIPWTLTGATIYLNVASEHTAFGRVAHAVLPVLWVIAVEVGAHVIRVRSGIEAGTRMDSVRASRWLLAPLRTASLWRRMVLWEVRSYPSALVRERDRLLALTDLQDAYGWIAWRWKAPRRTRALFRLGELQPTGQQPEPYAPKPGRPAIRPAKKPRTTGHRTDRDADARALLAAHPEMTGTELGLRLKVSDRTGRRIHARVTALLADQSLNALEGTTA